MINTSDIDRRFSFCPNVYYFEQATLTLTDVVFAPAHNSGTGQNNPTMVWNQARSAEAYRKEIEHMKWIAFVTRRAVKLLSDVREFNVPTLETKWAKRLFSLHSACPAIVT